MKLVRKSRSVAAGEFKTHCLQLMTEVQQSGTPLTVTKRGKPVVEIRPVAQAERSFYFGMARDQIKIVGDIVSPLPDESEYDLPNLR